MQIHSFVSRFHLQHFTCLRALALDHLHSSRTISTVIGQCYELIHLDLTHCLFSNDDPSVSDLFNTIWSLRNLVRCHIDIRFKRGMEAILPTVISTSLQDLAIKSFYYGSEDLARLFQHTPYLRHLRLVLSDDAADGSLRSSIPLIVRLRFSVYESSAIMSDLLRKLPNLHYLTAETDDLDWDGHSWQQMITDHLPKLKRFRLYMILRFADDENKEQRVDRLLESFQTRFWLERRWFVRCDWDLCEECNKNILYLYTIPFIGEHYFFHEVNFRTKSTCPDPENYETFECVRRLEYGLCPSSETPFSSQFCFKNVHHLDVSLPVDATFRSMIPQFDQLISLEVGLSEGNLDLDNYAELQALLDQASHLYTLNFRSWSSTSTRMPPFDYSNSSVSRLDVQKIDQCYNPEQCVALVRSPVGLQCQVLCITVENRTSILDLIEMMKGIRILNVLRRDDPHSASDHRQSSSTEDELLNWLQHRLPSTCTIFRNNEDSYNNRYETFHSILIWIG